MYKTEVIDKDTVEKRIVTRLIVLWKKKRKKLFHDRIIIEEGGLEIKNVMSVGYFFEFVGK